jgi:pimeloyl-ACP methyl ester carboxylesterase
MRLVSRRPGLECGAARKVEPVVRFIGGSVYCASQRWIFHARFSINKDSIQRMNRLHDSRLIHCCIRIGALCLLFLGCGAGVRSAPCLTSTPSCTGWISIPGQSSRLLVYTSYPLNSPNAAISRAFILIHGGSRDAGTHFRSAVAAGFLADALGDTVIVAPRFASNRGNSGGAACDDPMAAGEIAWTCDLKDPESWRSGGPALGHSEVTSFDFMDEILRTLARRENFPNLKVIVVGGHSAGGQFVTRYQMSNQLHENLGVEVSYIVANASGAYLDPLRPTAAAYPASASAPGYLPPPPSNAFAPFADERNCVTYDNWPYGLKNRKGYAARLSDDQLKKQLVSRPAIYLLGEYDVLPLAGFDSSCPAMAQGPTRLARGIAYGKYVNERYGAHHKTIVVPLCGHNVRCMFTSDVALPLAFPKP